MLKHIPALLLEAAKEWQKDNSFQRGAAIAFFATFSVAPILIIGISVSGFFFGIESVREATLARVEGFIGPDGIQFLSGVMEKSFEPADNVVAILVGLGALLSGAAGIFFQVKESLDRMWSKFLKENKGGVKQIVKGFALPVLFVFAIGIIFIVMSLFRIIMTFLSKFLSEYVNWNFNLLFITDYIFSLAITAAVFMTMFRVFSPVKYQLRHAFWGALVSALLLQLSRFVVDSYIGFAGVSVIYGAAGSLAVVMVWILFASLIFLYGAEVAKVLVLRDKRKPLIRS